MYPWRARSGSAKSWQKYSNQCAKTVVSDSLGLVYFAVKLVNSVLARWASNFWGGNSNYRRSVINPVHQFFSG